MALSLFVLIVYIVYSNHICNSSVCDITIIIIIRNANDGMQIVMYLSSLRKENFKFKEEKREEG